MIKELTAISFLFAGMAIGLLNTIPPWVAMIPLTIAILIYFVSEYGLKESKAE